MRCCFNSQHDLRPDYAGTSKLRASIALHMQVGLYVLLPLAFVQLYTYMLKQRFKRLAGKEKRR